MATPIYVFGSSNTDMVVKSTRLPGPGETVLGGTFMMNPGGKGANQAVAAARLGGSVTFLANVGSDLFGEQAINQFKAEGIDTSFITVDPSNPSGVALITVDQKGENCIVVAPGANASLTPDLLISFLSALKPPGIALVQLEIPLATVYAIIETCGKRNIPVIVNPAPAAPIEENALRSISILTPNETEAELLSGIRVHNDLAATIAATKLHSLGIPSVVITLGAKGAFWSTHGKSGFVRVPQVRAQDTTAAGDCFNGALAVALGEGRSLEQATQFACAAAAVSVTRMGAQASMPTRKEVDTLT